MQDPIVRHSQSPYNGYDRNPVFFADPSGERAETGQTAPIYYDWDKGGWRNQEGGMVSSEITGVYQSNNHSEMDIDLGVNADGNVFNEISVHVYDQEDPNNPRVLNWFNEKTDGFLWDYANSDEFAPPGVVVVYAHGDKTSTIIGPNGEKIKTSAQLEDVLIKCSPDYKKFKETEGSKLTLVLKVCYSARGKENIAKKPVR